jgi:hypothetical protein
MVPTGGGGGNLLRAVSLRVVSAAGCWAMAQKQERTIKKQNIYFMPFKLIVNKGFLGSIKNKARCKNSGLLFIDCSMKLNDLKGPE